jgi:hypothetical protein
MGCGCGRRAKAKVTLSSKKKNTNKNRKSDLLAKKGNSIRKKRLTKIVSSPKGYK